MLKKTLDDVSGKIQHLSTLIKNERYLLNLKIIWTFDTDVRELNTIELNFKV